MGSILNFIVPYTRNSDNQPPSPFMDGPGTCEIFSEYENSHSFEIKDGYENILLIETVEKFKEARNILKNGFDGVDVVSFVKDNNIKLLICSVADPAGKFEKEDIVDDIKKYGLTESTYFLESNFAHKNQKNTLCWHFFLEDAIRNIHQIYNGRTNELGYTATEIQENEIDVIRDKKFLCFNRTVDRKHRVSLLYDYINNDFSDSYFSFLIYNTSYEFIFQKDEIDYNPTDLKKYLPIELDTQSIENKSSFQTGDALKKDLFLNSCIHLVTETSFIDNEIFISEKILKPILGFQPFIVMGPYGYLKELKKYGFKTFSDFWDESYDNIEDPKERYYAIMDVVLNLNSKTIEELNELYQKTKNICIYNRDNFYKMKTNFSEIINSLYNEK